MFHRLLGWYISYCAAPLVTGISERKHNKTPRLIGCHAVYYSILLVISYLREETEELTVWLQVLQRFDNK